MAKLLPMQNELQDPAPRTLGGWGGGGAAGDRAGKFLLQLLPFTASTLAKLSGLWHQGFERDADLRGGGGAKTHIQLA